MQQQEVNSLIICFKRVVYDQRACCDHYLTQPNPTPQLQSFPASDLSYSNACQLINKPSWNPIPASVHWRNMLTIDFVNKIISFPTVTSLRLRMVVLQTMTGKMTGVKWWSFIFAPRFCDVSVLPCLVEIVNTKKTQYTCLLFCIVVRSVDSGRVVCDCGSWFIVYTCWCEMMALNKCSCIRCQYCIRSIAESKEVTCCGFLIALIQQLWLAEPSSVYC